MFKFSHGADERMTTEYVQSMKKNEVVQRPPLNQSTETTKHYILIPNETETLLPSEDHTPGPG